MISVVIHPKVISLMVLMLALGAASCAPIQPTNPAGPRASAYPVLLVEDNLRRETAMAAANRLRQTIGLPVKLINDESSAADAANPTESNLSPITATISNLPAGGNQPLYLPKIGVDAVMNEEETRESLRRFIREWRLLIGADPARLALVEHKVEPDGTNVANYDHRPFRYALRGNYGKLQIRFTPDRRVLSLVSTCIPDAERVSSALGALAATGALADKLEAVEAIKELQEHDITYTNPAGVTSTFRLPLATEFKPTELVTYVRPSATKPNTLEFHIAWEIEVDNAPVKRLYVDSINGEILAAL